MRSLIPKYQLLAQVLRQEIITGRLAAGAQLPTEEKLVRQYAFSRETVRKAIGQLEAEGLVRRAQGSGSFVNAARPDAVAFHFAEAQMASGDINYRLIQQEVSPATIQDAEILKILPGTAVISIAQVKLENGLPTAYSERRLPQSLCPELASADLTRRSVHDLLAEGAELPPMRAVVEIEGRALSESEAQWLEMSPGAPVVEVTRLSYTAPNQPAVWYHGLFKDRYIMEIELEAHS